MGSGGLAEGCIADGCGPVQALFLVHFVDLRGGVPAEIQEKVREARFPWRLLKRLRWSRPAMEPVEYGLHPAPLNPDSRQRHEYITCRHAYFASHPATSFESEVGDILSQLGIH